jgi:hypothetical protein
MFRLLGLEFAARDRQQVLLSRDRDVVRREARNRQRDAVRVLARAHDVVGRVVVLPFEHLGIVEEIEQAIEADGRPP